MADTNGQPCDPLRVVVLATWGRRRTDRRTDGQELRRAPPVAASRDPCPSVRLSLCLAPASELQ